MSNFVDKLKEKLNSVSQKIDEAMAPEYIKEQRINICKECDQFIKITSQCKMCGCYMPAKTALSGSTCPLRKWGKISKEHE